MITDKKISPQFDSRVVIGYHGTSVEKAELALLDRKLLVSRNDAGDWLAEGAYFWEGSVDMAKRWAYKIHPGSPAVLRAEIKLGRCLDLTDSKWDDALTATASRLRLDAAKQGKPFPDNQGYKHYRDFRVIEALCGSLSVDTVRGAFIHDDAMVESGFGHLTHVEIAVRNPEMIISLERVYPSPFTAYLASALTGLTVEQRSEIDVKQEIIKQVCRDRGIDLYLPKEKTDPEIHKEVSPEEVYFSDIRQVLKSDLLILMTDHPSFGAGMEFKTALDALLPIIVISPSNKQITRMVKGRPSVRSCLVEYGNNDELRQKLEDAIGLLRQNITDRKENLKTEDTTIGTQIGRLRPIAGLSQEQLAASVGLTAEAESRIETSPDYLTNPSLLTLRKLAQALGVSVAELVDPDFMKGVATETLSLASQTNLLVRGRQANEKTISQDQLAILLVALEDRLRKSNRN